MKDHKYTTSFSSEIRPLITEERDRYLALASLTDIGNFIPEIDTDKEIDLLPIAFNAFVANRVNRNDDVIDTSTALDVYKSFVNKPINLEHDRKKVVGVILAAGFSEFGTDKPVSEEEIKGKNIPFNVTLGGVIWRVTDNKLATLIEDASDPTSEHYMQISASWELGFSDYNLVVLNEEDRNLENARFIKDQDEIEELKENLRALGGSGKLNDKKLYRQVVGNVVPLGIGLTETPAADVKGIATEFSEESKDDKIESSLEKSTEKEILEKSTELISQNNETNVDIKHRNVMKITKLSEITDESLKELSASSINDFIQEEIKKASDEYVTDKEASEEKFKAANEQHESLVKEHEGILDELDKVKLSLTDLEQEKAARESLERFSRFMSSLDDEYDLNEEDRRVLANDVKNMGDKEFDDYRKKMAILLNHKQKKEEVEATEVTEEVKKEKLEVSASEAKAEDKVEDKVEKKAEVKTDAKEEINPEEILDNVVAGKEKDIPNSSTVEEETLYDKYKNAFSIDNFDISIRKF